MSKKLINGLWKIETAKIRAALPKKKKNLTSLLKKSSFELGDGEISHVIKSDLDYLTEILPSSLWDEIKLPLIFQKKKQLYTLLGGKLEHWVVETILNITKNSPYLLTVYTPRKNYFVYQYRQVQKKLSSITFLTFAFEE
jgi:uncharacterized protein (UPF0216 family)